MQHSDNNILWTRRFAKTDAAFFSGLEQVLQLPLTKSDLVHQFPLVTGAVNLAKYLALYEVFKQVQHLSGHYADVGTWKGASFLFIAKLLRLFEPHTISQVHAFDWFRGMDPDKPATDGNYAGDYETLVKLVQLQQLDDVAVVHQVDLITELPAFAKDPIYGPLYFKYVYMDCGYRPVLEQAVPFFWQRLVTGGIMVFDHFATDVQDETELVRAVLPPGTELQVFPFARQPTAYARKTA